MARSVSKLFAVAVLGAALSACSAADRLRNVGEAPQLTPIQNPQQQQQYVPVSLPMPQPDAPSYQPNSLWQDGARAFFKDQRATKVGDLLTVNIAISDKAEIDNATTRTRSNAEDADFSNFLGIESNLGSVFPNAVDPTSLVSLGSTSSSTGAGEVDREESIELVVAAYVTQVLPNGNFVIRGTQEVRVNYEVRELFVTGVVRPEDITNDNTVDHTQIAEARIAYGGRGQITDVQQPRYGQQVYDIIMPF